MAEQTSFTAGFLGTFRRLRDTLFNTLENRLQIVELEIKEEKERAIVLCISAAVLLLTGLMTLICLSFLLVIAFWDQAFWVALGLTIFYACGGLAAMLVIRNKLKTPPFAETINQIKKDREWLSSRK